jgi:hypothetical protein
VTIALLLSIVLAPVTALLAAVGTGIWMLVHEREQPAAEPT